MTDFHQFHLNLLKLGYNNLIKQPPFNSDDTLTSESDELLALFEQVIAAYEEHAPEAFALGQTLMTRIVGAFPQHLPLLSRDLLWLFGGDCIHYLGDEEIEQYQALDEARFEQESRDATIDYLQLRNMMITPLDDKRH